MDQKQSYLPFGTFTQTETWFATSSGFAVDPLVCKVLKVVLKFLILKFLVPRIGILNTVHFIQMFGISEHIETHRHTKTNSRAIIKNADGPQARNEKRSIFASPCLRPWGYLYFVSRTIDIFKRYKFLRNS